jgi:hypothetical protein
VSGDHISRKRKVYEPIVRRAARDAVGRRIFGARVLPDENLDGSTDALLSLLGRDSLLEGLQAVEALGHH